MHYTPKICRLCRNDQRHFVLPLRQLPRLRDKIRALVCMCVCMYVCMLKIFTDSAKCRWGCLKWGHLNSNCRVRKICKVCSEAHPTSLHGDNRKSRSKLATKSKDDSPRPRQEPNKVKDSSNEDRTISNCIEVCKTNTYRGANLTFAHSSCLAVS